MEPKPAYPSSSQVTRYQPPIQLLPVYAACGYGVGLAISAIPPLMRGESWKGAVRANALKTGPRVAAWMGLQCLFVNTLPYLRKKKDDWNGIIGFGLAAGPPYRHLGIIGMTQFMIGAAATYGMLNTALDRMRYVENKEAESKETQKDS